MGKQWRRAMSWCPAVGCGTPSIVSFGSSSGAEVHLVWSWSGGNPASYQVEYQIDNDQIWLNADGSPVDGDEVELVFDTGAGPDTTVQARIRAQCANGLFGDWVYTQFIVIG